jgi:diaminopimelate decarboxylase
VELAGLQVFWGSQYFDADVILAARKAALERATELAARRGAPFGFVSLGGGIAMPWRDGEPDVDWPGLAAAGLVPLEDRPAEVVACEYGRSVVGPAGSLITTVLDTKTIDGRRYVLVDAGLNHVMIASRLVAGSGRGEPSVRAVGRVGAVGGAGAVGRAYVTGPLCSQLDVLAEDVPLPEVAVGDLLVFSGVGAYGPSFSPAGFLSREPVREVVH